MAPATPPALTKTTQTDPGPKPEDSHLDYYASAKGSLIPYGAVSTPIGYHLLPANKEKFWRGKFVDIFSLVFREEETRDKTKKRTGIRRVIKRKR